MIKTSVKLWFYWNKINDRKRRRSEGTVAKAKLRPVNGAALVSPRRSVHNKTGEMLRRPINVSQIKKENTKKGGLNQTNVTVAC